MKYKYIGTVKQLEEHGFNVRHNYTLIHGIRYIDDTHELYIVLETSLDYHKRLIEWNDNNTFDDITPYIQDLIDANLVEVIA